MLLHQKTTKITLTRHPELVSKLCIKKKKKTKQFNERASLSFLTYMNVGMASYWSECRWPWWVFCSKAPDAVHRTSVCRVLGSPPYALSIPTATISSASAAIAPHEATDSTSTRGGYLGGVSEAPRGTSRMSSTSHSSFPKTTSNKTSTSLAYCRPSKDLFDRCT